MLTRILARHPDDAEAQHLLAPIYAGDGKLPQAVDPLRAWQAVAANKPDPHSTLAQVRSQIDVPEEALREQQQVVLLAPSNADDRNDLGVMEARAGNKTAAQQQFRRALELDPTLAAARDNLDRLLR